MHINAYKHPKKIRAFGARKSNYIIHNRVFSFLGRRRRRQTVFFVTKCDPATFFNDFLIKKLKKLAPSLKIRWPYNLPGRAYTGKHPCILDWPAGSGRPWASSFDGSQVSSLAIFVFQLAFLKIPGFREFNGLCESESVPIISPDHKPIRKHISNRFWRIPNVQEHLIDHFR